MTRVGASEFNEAADGRLGPHNVRILFRYEPTGHLYWTEEALSRRPILKGKLAVLPVGRQASGGYLRVRVFRTNFAVHRVVFLWHRLRWPKKGMHIHHKDGIRINNTIENLEEVLPETNMRKRMASRRAKHISREVSKTGLVRYQLNYRFTNLMDAERALKWIKQNA
jgi:hypothetical protein